MREPTYFILLSLATQPRHGYAIRKDIQFLSDNRITMSASTLYTALKRLLDQGWIMREPDPSANSARERKVYRLTEIGRTVLEAEVARLEALVAAAGQRKVSRSAPG